MSKKYTQWNMLAKLLLLSLVIVIVIHLAYYIKEQKLESNYNSAMDQLAGYKCKALNNITAIYNCYINCYAFGISHSNSTNIDNITNETLECYKNCERQNTPIYITGYYSEKFYCLGRINTNLGSCSNSNGDKNFKLQNGFTCYNGETYDIVKVIE